MTTYKCTTCGAINSRRSNGDNAWCSECGDTEGLEEVSYGIGLVEYGKDSSKIFDTEFLEEAIFKEGQLGDPPLLEVGPVHWLAHKFGWNEARPVVCRYDGTTFIGFKCEGCEYISVRPYKQEVYTGHRRGDWPDDLWPNDDPEYLKNS